MKVDREHLLQSLESVTPGLSSREIMEQSSCFVFFDGKVVTYNEEVACTNKALIDVQGAVKAEPLLNILRKLTEDTIEVFKEGPELRIRGKRKEVGLLMEEEVLLPIDSVEDPGEWKPLDPDFIEGLRLVELCASRDKTQFIWTCIHIHPKWIEACDNYQLARFKVKMNLKEPCLIRRDAIQHIISLGMLEYSETKTWMHFRNHTKEGEGLVLSCRRYAEEYRNLTPMFKVSGKPAQLPKGLAEAASKAEVFSSQNAEMNTVMVELRPGKLRIFGEGSYGWYREVKKLVYDGDALAFSISPKLLVDIVNRNNECEITSDRLKVSSGRFCYVAALSKGSEE